MLCEIGLCGSGGLVVEVVDNKVIFERGKDITKAVDVDCGKPRSCP